jgi:hypothetical protein
MKDAAIKEIITNLKDRGEKFETMTALDFFAREGDWQTSHYAFLVSELHAWEINPSFEEKLRENLPKSSKITIGDSHILGQECQFKFDLIVIDNPQGVYGEKYCEHFDALKVAISLFKDTGILIFNVKTAPFDYDDKVMWKKRRNDFYGQDSAKLQKDFIHKFYENLLRENGFMVEYSFMTERPQEDNLFAYTAKIKREKP